METVVPGQTRTSPPRDNRKTAVSAPAVSDDPAAILLPSTITSPGFPVTGTIEGAPWARSESSAGGLDRAFLCAFKSSGGFSRTVSRLPSSSHV